jgi:mannose-6-phosphate isomerase-like protein (cupin superfamily)
MASPTDVAAQPLWFLEDLVHVHVDGEQTGEAMSLVEFAGRRGDMPPLHIDHRNDETVYLLDGGFTFFVGEREIALSEGQAAVAPRGVPHTYPDRVREGPLAGDQQSGRLRALPACGQRAGARRRASSAGACGRS